MPQIKTRNLFISHSWRYGDAYEKLIRLLSAAPNFIYRDYSIPKDDPVLNVGSTQELYDAIKTKVSFCHVVLIMAGKYATYSKWIQREIRIASVEFNKPIVGVCPWGAEQLSSTVRDASQRIARWNSQSIVTAIREVC
jgi:hypothetical protein